MPLLLALAQRFSDMSCKWGLECVDCCPEIVNESTKITNLDDALSNPVGLVNFHARSAFFADITQHFVDRKGFSVATLNLDHIVKMRQNHDFATAYVQHSHVVADGNPIVWMTKLSGREMDLMPGSELIAPLAKLAAEYNVPIALLGATDETLKRATEALVAENPGLDVVCQIAPPYGFDPTSDTAKSALEEIHTSGAGLCFLALGAPKQEQLAVRGADFAPHCGFVSIGAGLDFIAGHQIRAPVWVQKIAMEWLWRMLSNPKRLAKRYALCFAILPGLIIKALRNRRDKGT